MPGGGSYDSAAARPVPLNTVITANLDKVLHSSAFKNAGSLRELLRFTVAQTLAGRGSDLKEYVLGTAVLKKPASFDPKTDPIVRVQMRRVRDRLQRYYLAEGRFDSLLIDIPRGTYTPVFRRIDAGSPPVTPAPETLIVGRQRELSELRSSFESAAAGRGCMICLCGEPGIGKTTVVDLFLRELAASGIGCSIARGACSERLAGSEAYLPVLEALETLLRDDDSRDLMSSFAPSWYAEVAQNREGPPAVRIPSAGRLASQENLKRELVVFLEKHARLRPVVLFLDDLHWADASTVDVLSYLANRCGSRRIFVVGAYRPAEALAAHRPFISAKLELQGRGLCREIAMEFLTRADIDRYLALRFPRNHFPPELSARIYRRTEGNPLFMADVVRLLADRGAFIRRDGGWVLAEELSEIEQQLPESIRSMIQKKICQLSDGDRRLITAAAVQGLEFDSVVLARALEIDSAEAEERLEALDRMQGLVRLVEERELPDSTLALRYQFVHVLYQNAFQNALTGARKSALSLAVARALLHFYQDRSGEVAAELALLFAAGRDWARASDYFLSAAGNAGRICAAREAIALDHRAIANAEKLKGGERATRVMAAAFHSAAQYELLTEFNEAAQSYGLAETAAAELPDAEAQVAAIYGKAWVLFLAKRLAEVNEEGVRALHLAQAGGSAASVASSNVILALEPFCSGAVAIAKEHFDRAIDMLRNNEAPKQTVDAVCFRGIIHSHRLEHDQANADLGWAYDQAARLGLNFNLLIALFHQARTRGNQGRLYEAAEMLKEAQRLAELLGDRFWRPRIVNTQGWVLGELFDTENALRSDSEAVQMAREFGDIEAECMSRINLAHDYLALGEPQKAWEHLREAQTLYERDVWFRWIYYPRMEAEIASYWITRGDLVQALSHARASLEDASRTLSRKRIAWAYKLLGDIAALGDRPGDAYAEFKTALELLVQHPCPTIEWRILQAAAAAAHLLANDAERDDLLGRARGVVRRLAASIRDDVLRRRFSGSKAVRDLLG
jgi:tetratricopeptide (TPR) repeat protein